MAAACGGMGSPGQEEEREGEPGERNRADEEGKGAFPSDPQRQMLDKCVHALQHAENDSQTLAALLLITRVCPANRLDKPTLRRVFKAVGLNLPARLLLTAVRDGGDSGLAPADLVSLAAGLLAALSTDPDMAAHPQLLSSLPLLLSLVSNGLGPDDQEDGPAGESGEPPSSQLDEGCAADCYHVLTSVCALPLGPQQLLSRGAIPALCRAVQQNRTLSRQRGLPLLGSLLCASTKKKAWSKHGADLMALLLRLCSDFCRASEAARLATCAQLSQFLPPPGVAPESEELRQAVSSVWVELRPMLQGRLSPRQIGSVLVLSACLLDLCGWGAVGPPKFCCLLVNRACVEVRMGLEEPPGNELSLEQQNTLTGCYRIMEAAMEQACSAPDSPASPSALTLQQSRQVLEVLQEAFSAVMFHLQQVDSSRHGDPFVFASFRSLCSWLAEETSCLKQEVMDLLPFLVGYARHHLEGGAAQQGLSDWMAKASISEEGGTWTGEEALRYLLPALCHLSAEDAPRAVLLGLDTPGLLVDFLLHGWASAKGRGPRDPSMETACSGLLNFTVTELQRLRSDKSFQTLQTHLNEALPVLVNKPRLLVLAANYCTLGLMIGRLESPSPDPVEAGQKRFFSAALRFLRGSLDSDSGSGSVRLSSGWQQSWDEVSELWALSLQALGSCIRTHSWLAGLVREEDWLGHTLTLLRRGDLPDQSMTDALEGALCAAAESCSLSGREVREAMKGSEGGGLRRMRKLKAAAAGSQ